MDTDEWDAEQYEVMPKAIIAEVKSERKELRARKRELAKLLKAFEKRFKVGEQLHTEIQNCKREAAEVDARIAEKEDSIKHHVELENELKECRKKIREIEQSKEALADKAREQISDDDARRLISARWLQTLHETIAVYLEAHARKLQQDIELLHDKYTVTLTALIAERQRATEQLDAYLKELGYVSK